MKILVSACLIGENCKYNGKNNRSEKVLEYIKNADKVVAVCPEVLGGLDIPRDPSEIKGGKVITKKGKDVTLEFIKGAEEALSIAKEENIDIAILQSRSPSCGVNEIYDGNFEGKLTCGEGIFAKMLKNNGFKVIDAEDI